MKSIKVCDAGDTVEFGLDRPPWGHNKTAARGVAMVIVAPRGRAVIFEPSDSDSASAYYQGYEPQSEAVKAFMEQHRNDG